MKTLEELIGYIDSAFPIGHGTNCSRAVTGEPYVVIGSQHPEEGMPKIPGTVDEGRRREWGFDEETAVMQAAACFGLYADGRRGKIYWRHPPTLEKEGNRFLVYMRCLISAEPEKHTPCENCNCGYARQQQPTESGS